MPGICYNWQMETTLLQIEYPEHCCFFPGGFDAYSIARLEASLLDFANVEQLPTIEWQANVWHVSELNIGGLLLVPGQAATIRPRLLPHKQPAIAVYHILCYNAHI